MSVYFARVGDYIKVGFSENPERRVRNLFKSATRYSRPNDCPTDPSQRELLASIPGDLGVEWKCHRALADFAVGGEFFVDEPPVREFIAEARAGRFPHMERADGPARDPFDDGLTDAERAQLSAALNDTFPRRLAGRASPHTTSRVG